MNEKNLWNSQFIGDESVIKRSVDLSGLDICFSSKPLVIGGLAMEYYGIRNKGEDIDFIVTADDYEALAGRYPNHRRDKWGDLFVSLDHCELLRSIFRFDYDFLSQNAIEYEMCKVISLERLFFMKVLAYDNQPEIEKHASDYRLMWDFLLKTFQNEEYVAYGEKHVKDYLSSPGGTVLNGGYRAE